MFARSISLFLAVMVLALFVTPAFAHEKAEGDVVKVGQGKLTIVQANKKEATHEIGKDVTVMLDGKAAKVEDLKEGLHVVLGLGDKHVITKIEAHSKTAKK